MLRLILPRAAKALAFLLLLVFAFAGGVEGFRYVKLRLALSRAEREFLKRDFPRAEFWAAGALRVDETNLQAMRLMAEIDEVRNDPAAVGWRIKIVRREPGNSQDVMAWAKSALRFGQTEWALRALKSLPPGFGDRSAEYHELMAGCALADNETRLAEEHFAKAAGLDPGNPMHRVNLAAFRLANSPGREVRLKATRDLEAAMADSRVRLFAARALLSDAIQSGDQSRAQRFAGTLRSLPNRDFSDDLNCLETLISTPAFPQALEKLEQGAEPDATRISQAGDWLNAHGMAGETLRWFAKLPEASRSDVHVQMTAAEAYSALRDWKGLEAFLAKCDWPDGNFLKEAMLVRCERELSQPWEAGWTQLVAEAKANPPDAILLARLVAGWKWRNETLDLLWGAASRPATDTAALELLWRLYSATNETRELLRVAQAQIDIDPSNPARKNNFAFLSLLLEGASGRSERLAREASAADPKVPEWAATYAYALHLAGEDARAKEVIGGLSPDALERPGVALYYAIVLAANGDYAQSRKILGRVNANGMLPEEQRLALDLAQKLNAAH